MLFTSTPNGLNHIIMTSGKVQTEGLLMNKVSLKKWVRSNFAPWYKIPGRDDKWKQRYLKGTKL